MTKSLTKTCSVCGVTFPQVLRIKHQTKEGRVCNKCAKSFFFKKR